MVISSASFKAATTLRNMDLNRFRIRQNDILSKLFKGPCHEIYDLWFFSSNNSIWALDKRVKAFLHMASYSRRYTTMKSTLFVVSSFNDTADHKSYP
jgi:hypothetical protein